MSKRILILDNDPGVLDVMQDILNYEGFDVKALADTDDIFKWIKDYNPDLVMLDYLLDGINGGEICAQIKKNPQTSSLPVVIISAYSRVLLSLGTYGCNEFIAKPFELNDFLQKVNVLTGNFYEQTIN